MSGESYQKTNIVGTMLQAPEVLMVDSAINYLGTENEFNLASIKIAGANGSIDLDGKQAQTQFQIGSDTNYVLQYR